MRMPRSAAGLSLRTEVVNGQRTSPHNNSDKLTRPC